MRNPTTEAEPKGYQTGSVKRIGGPDAKGQGMVEYALLIALLAIVVMGLLALVGTLVSDVMAMMAEVLGSQCTPGLQMVYSHQHFTAAEFEPSGIFLAWPTSGRIS